MRLRHSAVGVVLAFLSVAAIPACAKTGPRIPCQTIFVTGTQPYAIAWANKNLAKDTDNCLVPVASPSGAAAILLLRADPKLVVNAKAASPQPGPVWASCASGAAGVHCFDSGGNVLDVDCWPAPGGVSCTSYYGPNPAVAIAQLLYALMARHLARTAALGVLYQRSSRRILWRFGGAGARNMFSVRGTWNGSIEASSACPKRWGTYGKYCKRAKRPEGIAAQPPEPAASGR